MILLLTMMAVAGATVMATLRTTWILAARADDASATETVFGLSERQLLGLGILVLTLVLAMLILWKQPLQRNVGGGAWRTPAAQKYLTNHYAPQLAASTTANARGPTYALSDSKNSSKHRFGNGALTNGQSYGYVDIVGVAGHRRQEKTLLRSRTSLSRRRPLHRGWAGKAFSPQVRRALKEAARYHAPQLAPTTARARGPTYALSGSKNNSKRRFGNGALTNGQISSEGYKGTMKVRLKPISQGYEGTVKIDEADESEHRAVIKVDVRDARGHRGASATITSTLDKENGGDSTRVRGETDMQLTGCATQVGRGVQQDEQPAASEAEPSADSAAEEEEQPRRRIIQYDREADPLDLSEASQEVVLKRVRRTAPVAASISVLLIGVWLLTAVCNIVDPPTSRPLNISSFYPAKLPTRKLATIVNTAVKSLQCGFSSLTIPTNKCR
jgi:hypothetical protein